MENPPSQQMQVEVEDGLTCSSVDIQHEPITVVGDLQLAG